MLSRSRRLTENCAQNTRTLILTLLFCFNYRLVNAITNSQDQQVQAASLSSPQHYSHLQFPAFTEPLTRGRLSPQEQSHILTDVQQHRFLVNIGDRPRAEPPRGPTAFQQQPQLSVPPQQSQGPPQSQHHHYQTLFPPQQTFHHQFPQGSNFQIGNIANTFANSFHGHKKPILLQPTYPEDYNPKSQQQSQPQVKQQAPQGPPPQQHKHTHNVHNNVHKQTLHTSKKPSHQTFQHSFQQPPKQSFQLESQHTFQQPVFQSNFQPLPQAPQQQSPQFDNNNNYVQSSGESQPTRHQQYLTEVSQPKPAVPEYQKQAVPEYQKPAVPEYQKPALPEYQNPVVQEYQKPAVPEYQSDSFTPAPINVQPTQSWILETQPPTPYKTQKPYEAITFATEAYKQVTVTPKVVKYRARPSKQEDKYSSVNVQNSEFSAKPDRKKLYEQLVSGTTKSYTTARSVTSKRRTTTTATTEAPRIPDEQFIQEQLQKQIQEQLGNKDDPFKTIKITLPGELSSDQIANLPNIALGDSVAQLSDFPPQLPGLPSGIPQSVFLGGQKIKLDTTQGKPSKKGSTQIKTIVVNQPTPSTTTTTIKPPTLLFEELKKNILPPGANFEVIRQKQDGALEEVGNIHNLQQKKVTFVILEEQPDGSVKVQGVRGNENLHTDSKESEVESIIERLKKGEIKLPPSTKLSNSQGIATPEESQATPNYVKHENKVPVKPTVAPRRRTTTTRSPPAYHHSTQVANTHAGPAYSFEDYSTKRSTTTSPPRNKPEYSIPVRNHGPSFLPTVTTSEHHDVSNSISVPYTPGPPPSANYNFSPSPTYTVPSFTPSNSPSSYSPAATSVTTESTPYTINHVTNHIVSTDYVTTPTPSTYTSQSSANSALTDALRANGLFAMAKFLKQSGLDNVLNETGPYTLFVPTDKAFRALLVQLGGPDRAEIKFKENPRLLSGLLLHHVIPGAFKIDSLLDEMTGVSLAGTQLRVNTYVNQDQEWNDVKVITINGAKVQQDKADIVIPQGYAHTVDRVMFPLPVGDVIQTLQSDREGRFSKFIKLLQETGVAQTLQGSKTYTVFAPTDSAFTDGDLEKLLEQRGAARSLALRHITPGTLYSAGMLYYQLRDSMNSASQIQLSKEAGRVKVNNAHVISRNIPATNGVIHAIDSLL